MKIGDKVWYLCYHDLNPPEEIEIEVIFVNTERIIRINSDNEHTSVTYKSTCGRMIQTGELFTSFEDANMVYKERMQQNIEDRLERARAIIKMNEQIVEKLTQLL